MHRASVTLLVAIVALLGLPSRVACSNSAIVGARFVSCQGCRLSQLDSVKRFFDLELPKYAAATVDYIAGHNPDVEFLDRRRAVVKRYDLGPLKEEQIHQLLQQHGIFPHTPAPVYDAAPADMERTESCVAWRATKACDPAGLRDASRDAGCTTPIPAGVSGFCECSTGTPDASVPCDHDDDLTCELACDAMHEEGDL
jgi:hypothetical protein